jgi:hypothetical protein
MNRKLQLLNHSLLFLCASLYLGTGWSIVLFTFPITPQFTVDNYALHFVPQIASATIFFSVVTTLMIVTAAVMFWCERRTPFKWVPAVVLASVCCAASLTMIFIFPVNRAMTEGITDPAALAGYVARWKTLHSVRMAFWTTNWLAVMIYFAVKLYQRETEHGQLEMAQAGAARHRGGHGAERAGAGASA